MHCDIKTDNILIDKDAAGNIKELCISDFGLSLELHQIDEDVVARGSIPYAAPEVLDPEK